MDPTQTFVPCYIEQVPKRKALYTSGDNRQNIDGIDPIIQEQAKSVACMMPKSCMKRNSELNCFILNAHPTLKGRLSPGKEMDDPFQDEPSLGFGTAFYIGGDRLALTAGHCVCKENLNEADPQLVKTTRLVFGWIKNVKQNHLQVEANRVCKIEEVLKCFQDSKLGDWALIRLNKAPAGATPLTVDFMNPITNQQKIYMLGHPSGVPQKFTDKGQVKDMADSETSTFKAKIDAFAGNSGSPIFHDKKVVGILIQGNDDYDEGPTKTSLHRVAKGKGYEICQRTSSLPVSICEMVDKPQLEKREKAHTLFDDGVTLYLQQDDISLRLAIQAFEQVGDLGLLSGYFGCYSIMTSLKNPEADNYLRKSQGFQWDTRPLKPGEASAAFSIVPKGGSQEVFTDVKSTADARYSEVFGTQQTGSRGGGNALSSHSNVPGTQSTTAIGPQTKADTTGSYVAGQQKVTAGGTKIPDWLK